MDNINPLDTEVLAKNMWLDEFTRQIERTHSATSLLAQVCRVHIEAIQAKVITTYPLAPIPDLCAQLQLSSHETIFYRQVQLEANGILVSIADNFYVPDRLSRAMNEQLATTLIPFGRIILPLRPQRQNLYTHRLWHGESEIPAYLLEHSCLVKDAAGKILAKVVELYSQSLLNFSG